MTLQTKAGEEGSQQPSQVEDNWKQHVSRQLHYPYEANKVWSSVLGVFGEKLQYLKIALGTNPRFSIIIAIIGQSLHRNISGNQTTMV